jgi:hypothetical protein
MGTIIAQSHDLAAPASVMSSLLVGLQSCSLEEAAPATQPPPLLQQLTSATTALGELPDEVLLVVASHLGVGALGAFAQVDRRLRAIAEVWPCPPPVCCRSVRPCLTMVLTPPPVCVCVCGTGRRAVAGDVRCAVRLSPQERPKLVEAGLPRLRYHYCPPPSHVAPHQLVVVVLALVLIILMCCAVLPRRGYASLASHGEAPSADRHGRRAHRHHALEPVRVPLA